MYRTILNQTKTGCESGSLYLPNINSYVSGLNLAMMSYGNYNLNGDIMMILSSSKVLGDNRYRRIASRERYEYE